MTDTLQDHIHAPDPYEEDEGSAPLSQALLQFKRDVAGQPYAEQVGMLSTGWLLSPDMTVQLRHERNARQQQRLSHLLGDDAVQRDAEEASEPEPAEPIDAEPIDAEPVQLAAEPTPAAEGDFVQMAEGPLAAAPDTSVLPPFIQICKAINIETVGIYGPQLDAWLAAAGVPGTRPGAAMKALADILKLVNPVTVGTYGPLLDAVAAMATGPDLTAILPMLAQVMKLADPRTVTLYGPALDIWALGGVPNAAAAEAVMPEPLALDQMPPPEALTGGAPAHTVMLVHLLKQHNPEAAATAGPALDGFLGDPTNWDAFAEAAAPFAPDPAALQEWAAGGADPMALPELFGEDLAPWGEFVMASATVSGPMAFEVQAKSDGDMDSGTVRQAASEGVKGSGGALPHRDQIQSAFGGFDVSGVQAFVGGSATRANEAMGARAYATGSKIAFKSTPDLHTAAHEAAHVVQQRYGVSLPGGVGQVGDKYEKHADAVADRVVSGRPADDLLGQMTGAPSVQTRREPGVTLQQLRSPSGTRPGEWVQRAGTTGGGQTGGGQTGGGQTGSGGGNEDLKAQVTQHWRAVPAANSAAVRAARVKAEDLENQCTTANLTAEAQKMQDIKAGAARCEQALSSAATDSLSSADAFDLAIGLTLNACERVPALIAVKTMLTAVRGALAQVRAITDPPHDGLPAVKTQLTTAKGVFTEHGYTKAASDTQAIIDVIDQVSQADAECLSSGDGKLADNQTKTAAASQAAGARGFNKLKARMDDLKGRAWAIQQVNGINTAKSYAEQEQLLQAQAEITAGLSRQDGDPMFLGVSRSNGTLSGLTEKRNTLKTAEDAVAHFEETAAKTETKRADLDTEVATVNTKIEPVQPLFANAHTELLRRRDAAIEVFETRKQRELDLLIASREELKALAREAAAAQKAKLSAASATISTAFAGVGLAAAIAALPAAPIIAAVAAAASIATSQLTAEQSKRELSKRLAQTLGEINAFEDAEAIRALIAALRDWKVGFDGVENAVNDTKAKIEAAKAEHHSHSTGEVVAEVVATGGEVVGGAGSAIEALSHLSHGVELAIHGVHLVGPAIHTGLAINDYTEIAEKREKLKEQREKVDELRAELKLPPLPPTE